MVDKCGDGTMSNVDRRRYTHKPYTGSCEMFALDKRHVGGEYRPHIGTNYYHESAMREVVKALEFIEERGDWNDEDGAVQHLYECWKKANMVLAHYKDLIDAT